MRKFNYLCTRFWAFPPISVCRCTTSPGFVIGQYQRERHGGAWLESFRMLRLVEGFGGGARAVHNKINYQTIRGLL